MSYPECTFVCGFYFEKIYVPDVLPWSHLAILKGVDKMI